jgi:hypothetical protein
VSTVDYYFPRVVELLEDDLPVTMQIAMVGADGLLLASDTKIVTDWRTRRWYGAIREEHAESKIVISPEGTVAISCAGDMIRANEAANKIISEWKPEEDDPRASNLKQIVRIFSGGPSFECLIARLLPYRSIVRVSYVLEAGGKMHMVVTPCIDRLCAGDHANPAKYWHLRYYDQSRSMDDLIPLAAQLITDAVHFNNGIIGGLEIVVSDQGRLHRIPSKDCEALVSNARRISDSLFKKKCRFGEVLL